MKNLTRVCERNVPFFKQKGHMLTLIILSRPVEAIPDIPEVSLGIIFQIKIEIPSHNQHRLGCIIVSCSARLGLLTVG